MAPLITNQSHSPNSSSKCRMSDCGWKFMQQGVKMNPWTFLMSPEIPARRTVCFSPHAQKHLKRFSFFSLHFKNVAAKFFFLTFRSGLHGVLVKKKVAETETLPRRDANEVKTRWRNLWLETKKIPVHQCCQSKKKKKTQQKSQFKI